MYFGKFSSDTIDNLARKCLLDTLHTFMSGVMDYTRDIELAKCYEDSIGFLKGAFGMAFELGREYSCVESGLCFDMLRQKGRALESKLLSQTDGRHTHIGAMFSLALMSAAAGRLDALGIKFEPEYMIVTVADFARGFCYKAFVNLPLKSSELSDGEKLFKKTNQTSIRGAAEEGFRSYLQPALELLNSSDDNDKLVKLFLLLVSIIDDSRIILTHGADVMDEVKKQAEEVLSNYSFDNAKAFDSYLRKKNIVPKAAMGMHSLALFSHELLKL